eukprot:gene5616-9433_t
MTSVESQYVEEVVEYSSQHVAFRSRNAVGKDTETFWRPSINEEQHFITVKFKKAVYPKSVKIYEKKFVNCVSAIQGKSGDSDWIELWNNDKNETHLNSTIFSPSLIKKSCETKIQFLKLSLKNSKSEIPEIACIELIGNEYMTHSLKLIESLIQNPDFSDLKIKIINKEECVIISTHKIVFTQYSTLDMKTDEILLENVSVEATQALLYYLYTGKLKYSSKFKLRDLLFSSYGLGVKSLINQISKVLHFEQDCIEILNGNQKFPKAHYEVCKEYLQNNINRVIQHESFINLTAKNLIGLLQRIDLPFNEFLLFKNILQRWVVKQKVYSVEKYFDITGILTYIHFDAIPEFQMQQIIQKFPFVSKYTSKSKMHVPRKQIQFIESEILSCNQCLDLVAFSKPKLIYSSSYGFNTKEFEKRCLDSFKTFIIIEDEESNIFGAYISTCWEYVIRCKGELFCPKSYLFNFDLKIGDSIIPKQKIELKTNALLFKEKMNLKYKNGELEIGNVLKISNEKDCSFSNVEGSMFKSKKYFEKNFKIKKMEVFEA